MPKTLLMLIGPKGAGKSHIGRLLGERTAVEFLEVEAIWLALEAGEDGWRQVEAAIADAFEAHDQVMIESLGAGEAFEHFLARLKGRYAIRLIRVRAEAETCLARVAARDARAQLPASLEQVAAYNRIAAQVEIDWDAEIDNDGPASEAEILAALRPLLPK